MFADNVFKTSLANLMFAFFVANMWSTRTHLPNRKTQPSTLADNVFATMCSTKSHVLKLYLARRVAKQCHPCNLTMLLQACSPQKSVAKQMLANQTSSMPCKILADNVFAIMCSTKDTCTKTHAGQQKMAGKNCFAYMGSTWSHMLNQTPCHLVASPCKLINATSQADIFLADIEPT